MDRKGFLKKTLAVGGALSIGPFVHVEGKSRVSGLLAKPPRVRAGDTAAIVSPAGNVFSKDDLDKALTAVERLGLKPKLGDNMGSRWGYLAGRDTERLQDLHQAFEDPDVKVIFPIRGGYGSSRLLPMLDFELIRRHPKAFIGFSDNTSLVVAMNMFANMVTFYGPNAHFDWTNYTRENLQKMVMESAPAGILPYPNAGTGRRSPHTTIVPGRATGPLIGGNLSLLIQTLGTEWEIDTRGKILFFEDVNESPYRIDRMLTHLWLARKLQVAAGFAIGQITVTRDRSDDLDLLSVIRDRFEPLGKPCFIGMATGHVSNILTLPLGVQVEMDASAGQVRTVESAVA